MATCLFAAGGVRSPDHCLPSSSLHPPGPTWHAALPEAMPFALLLSRCPARQQYTGRPQVPSSVMKGVLTINFAIYCDLQPVVWTVAHPQASPMTDLAISVPQRSSSCARSPQELPHLHEGALMPPRVGHLKAIFVAGDAVIEDDVKI